MVALVSVSNSPQLDISYTVRSRILGYGVSVYVLAFADTHFANPAGMARLS